MKKLFCSLLTFLLVFFSFSVYSDDSGATVAVTIGDYFSIGTYNGSAILWRCVDIDSNGVLLLSDKAICKKSFDAAGYVLTGSHARGVDRPTFGSNYWADSNIRTWLNSESAAGEIVWPCGNAPTANGITDFSTAYDNEAGFLTGFSEEEISLMKEVSQISILDQYEYSNMVPYGTAPHARKTAVSQVVQNFDTAYREMVTDKMFLLDVKQINAVSQNFTGNYYIAKDMNGTACRSWLRTPRATLAASTQPRCVETSGSIGNIAANYSDVGVRPAFYLSETALIEGGDGTATSPYVVGAPAVTSGNIQISANLPVASGNTSGWVLTTIRNSAGAIVKTSIDAVTLSTEAVTPVTLTIEDADFVPGSYFDIYAWYTSMTPIINAEHFALGFEDGIPVFTPVSN